MKFLPAFVVLVVSLICSGCETFTKFRATDYRGGLIAEWVAKGEIEKAERGYRITAVERLSGPPYMTLTRYPEGWRTTVAGPNITYWRCGKPLWLYSREREGATIFSETRHTTYK